MNDYSAYSLVAHIREFSAHALLELDAQITELQVEAEANFAASLRASIWKRIRHQKLGKSINQCAVELSAVQTLAWLRGKDRSEFVSLHAYRYVVLNLSESLQSTPGYFVRRLSGIEKQALVEFAGGSNAWDQVLEIDVQEFHGDLAAEIENA